MLVREVIKELEAAESNGDPTAEDIRAVVERVLTGPPEPMTDFAVVLLNGMPYIRIPDGGEVPWLSILADRWNWHQLCHLGTLVLMLPAKPDDGETRYEYGLSGPDSAEMVIWQEVSPEYARADFVNQQAKRPGRYTKILRRPVLYGMAEDVTERP